MKLLNIKSAYSYANDMYGTTISEQEFENIALNEDTGRTLQKIIREYAAYHLDASNIKSESMV